MIIKQISTVFKNVWHTAKAVLGGKVIALKFTSKIRTISNPNCQANLERKEYRVQANASSCGGKLRGRSRSEKPVTKNRRAQSFHVRKSRGGTGVLQAAVHGGTT